MTPIHLSVQNTIKKCIIFPNSVQIADLEAQCNEANQEKQKNAQLSVRVQELEAELQDKEQVRHAGVETRLNWFVKREASKQDCCGNSCVGVIKD